MDERSETVDLDIVMKVLKEENLVAPSAELAHPSTSRSFWR